MRLTRALTGPLPAVLRERVPAGGVEPPLRGSPGAVPVRKWELIRTSAHRSKTSSNTEVWVGVLTHRQTTNPIGLAPPTIESMILLPLGPAKSLRIFLGVVSHVTRPERSPLRRVSRWGVRGHQLTGRKQPQNNLGMVDHCPCHGVPVPPVPPVVGADARMAMCLLYQTVLSDCANGLDVRAKQELKQGRRLGGRAVVCHVGRPHSVACNPYPRLESQSQPKL